MSRTSSSRTQPADSRRCSILSLPHSTQIYVKTPSSESICIQHALRGNFESSPSNSCPTPGFDQIGILCPHHNCLLIGQSRRFSSHAWYVLAYLEGVKRSFPSSRGFKAKPANELTGTSVPSIRPSPNFSARCSIGLFTAMYHWSERYGSIGTWLR